MSNLARLRSPAIHLAVSAVAIAALGLAATASAQTTFEKAAASLGVAPEDVRVRIVYPGVGGSPLDLHADGVIDIGDRRAFVRAFGSANGEPHFDPRADWDGDGYVGPRDRYAFVSAFIGWQGTDLGDRYDGGHALPVTAAKNARAFPTPKALASAVTEPPGLERFLSWSIDGAAAGTGGVMSAALADPGTHQIGVNLPRTGAADQVAVTAYRVAVYDPTRLRLFEPDRDYVLEGIDYAFEAMTEPPGFAEHVRWHAETRYGQVDYGHTGGEYFDVRFAHTFGVDDRVQSLMVQADNFVIDQQQQAAGQFPAALAHQLFDAFAAMGATIEAGADTTAGGRKVLTHIRDQFLPVYFEVLDFEIDALGLDAFIPFRANTETEVVKQINELLDTRGDVELKEIVYVDSELRLFPADFAFEAALPGRIMAETDSAGFLVSSSWVLKWLWNKSQAVLGCLAQGPAKIIHKLIGALHGAIHDGALDALAAPTPATPTAKAFGHSTLDKMVVDIGPTPAQAEALATLDELVKLSRVIVNGETATNGGRRVVRRVQNASLPFADGVLKAALADAGESRMKPFLDRGVADANKAMTALLDLRDDTLSAEVYSDISLLPAARSILAAEADIRRLIEGAATGVDVTDAPFSKLTVLGGFDIVKWLWDTLVGLIGCVPNIGALLEKLVGTVHDVAHAPRPTPVPTPAAQIAEVAFESLMETIVALEDDPGRGRTLALQMRDETLPAVLEVISLEVIDIGEAHLAESAALAVAAQQNRMTALLERSDDSLNAGLYDNKGAVRAYAETYVEVFGVNDGVDATGFETRAGGGNIWNDLMRFIKCLSEGSSTAAAASAVGVDATRPDTRGDDGGKSDKLIWAIEQIHSFLH